MGGFLLIEVEIKRPGPEIETILVLGRATVGCVSEEMEIGLTYVSNGNTANISDAAIRTKIYNVLKEIDFSYDKASTN